MFCQCHTGLAADITSCITQAENCMSLLLSDDMFHFAMDPADHDDDRAGCDDDQAGHDDEQVHGDDRAGRDDDQAGHDDDRVHGDDRAGCDDDRAGHDNDRVHCDNQAGRDNDRVYDDDQVGRDDDQTVHDDDFDNTAASHVADSRDCEETNEELKMKRELAVLGDGTCESQCEHSSVDCETELSADDVSSDRSADVATGCNKSPTSSATAVDTRCHHTQSDSDSELREVNLHRQHGVHSFRYALHIDIATHIRVDQTEHNADVVRTLQELATVLINRYLPTVKRWLEVNIHHRCL